MIEFAISVFRGLFQAAKTDVNVFLLGLSVPALSIKRFKAFGGVVLFYVGLRRIDEMMSAYVSLKNKEIESRVNQNV